MREIAIAGQLGGSRVGAPLQAEALAYFGRMTTPPSAAFRDAVNWAIWRWKATGAWSLIKGLWWLAADTSQAGLLSVIGDTPRDAVIVGTAPTFTALKGFSGFDAGKQVRFPITADILASDSVFGFVAAKVVPQVDMSNPESPVTVTGRFVISDAGDTFATPGHFGYGNLAGGIDANTIYSINDIVLGGSIIVGGAKGSTGITAGGVSPAGSTGPGARSSNYITRSLALTPLNRLCAYGFLDASATTAQCRQFVAILATALDMIGALD